MEYYIILGYIAGLCSSLSFLPQIIKSWRSRSAHDISYGMIFLFATGVSLWMIYGIIIDQMPIIVANGVTLALVCGLFCMKVRFGR